MVDLLPLGSTTSSLCFVSPMPDPFSVGICAFSGRLGRKTALRVSSSCFSSQGSEQASTVQVSRNFACDSPVGNEDTLSSAKATLCKGTSAVASVPQVTETTTPLCLSSESKSSKSSCLLAEDSLKNQGFSDEVVERVLNPVRTSSKSCYDARWNCFVKYCKERNIDSSAVSIPQLAQFFQHLFAEKMFIASYYQWLP